MLANGHRSLQLLLSYLSNTFSKLLYEVFISYIPVVGSFHFLNVGPQNISKSIVYPWSIIMCFTYLFISYGHNWLESSDGGPYLTYAHTPSQT